MTGGKYCSRFVRLLFACMVVVGTVLPAGCCAFPEPGPQSMAKGARGYQTQTMSEFVGSSRLE